MCAIRICFIIVHDDIKKLVVTERIEALIPLTYIVMMTMAYYGPNAETMGSVRLRIWHHQNVINDIDTFATNVGLLAGVDLISFIVN